MKLLRMLAQSRKRKLVDFAALPEVSGALGGLLANNGQAVVNMATPQVNGAYRLP